MFGGLPPPVIPSKKSASSGSEVKQNNTAHQAAVPTPVTAVEQPGRLIEKDVFPDKLEQSSDRVKSSNSKGIIPSVEPVQIKCVA